MVIETIMYFALGFLGSALLALMIMPSVWRRAVRLTKKRMEAATPMTLAEFRADKDQLRAEFALSTRRLEMNVDALRKRLADQLSDINRKKTDLSLLKNERDQHLTIVRELEEREAEARRRILELEKEGADLSQRLRMRERDFNAKAAEIEAMRGLPRPSQYQPPIIDGHQLTGDYAQDIDELAAALALERQRASFLEHQTRSLISRLESTDRQATDAKTATAELRKALAEQDDSTTTAASELIDAEAKLASAENRLNELLEETKQLVEQGDTRTERLLAEKLSLEEELERLRAQVVGTETAILSDWDTERVNQAHLRERLNDIASEVSRIVYALDGDQASDAEESLFDKVQRFAEPEPATANLPEPSGGTRASDRLAALRDLREV